MIGSFFVEYAGSLDYVESIESGKGISYKAERKNDESIWTGLELDFLRIRKELTLNFPINASEINNDVGWAPAQIFTLGPDFPQSPNENDIHTYTGPTNESYFTNTMYRYEGTEWLVLGQNGTYIDATGVYTGTVAATQITTGYLDAARIEAGTITLSKLHSDAVRKNTKGPTFPEDAKEFDTHFLTADVGLPITHSKDILYVYDGRTPYNISGWDPIGSKGTYIDDTGIYTGLVNAAQVIAGTLTGFTIQTAAAGSRTVIQGGENSYIEFIKRIGDTDYYGSYVNWDGALFHAGGSIQIGFAAPQSDSAAVVLEVDQLRFFHSYPIPTTGTYNLAIYSSTEIILYSSTGQDIKFSADNTGAVACESLTVGGTNVSLEGHDHDYANTFIVSQPLEMENINGVNTIYISEASATYDGYLSKEDWETFNGKSTISIGSTITVTHNIDGNSYEVDTTAFTINGTSINIITRFAQV